MRSKLRQRTTAALLALLAQSGFVALFVLSRERRVAQEADSPYLIFIQPIQLPTAAPPRARATPTARVAISSRTTTDRDYDKPTIVPMEPDETNRTITLSPEPASHIDWYGNMQKSARRAVEKEAQRERRDTALNSTPRILVMPERPHLAGDTEAYSDGAVLTRLNERCYVMLEPHARKPARVCKTPTLAERRREAHRAELEKAMKPGYLSRPLPLPGPPQIRDER